MSEQEQEQEAQEPAEQPLDAPLAPDELEAEEEAEQDEQAQREPAEPPQEQQASALTPKDVEKLYARAEGRATTFRNGISEVFGEMAQAFEVCPLCADHLPGFLAPFGPTEEAITRTRNAMGLPDLSNFQQAKHARQCDDCAGLGVVLSGSQIAENAAISCPTCNGTGYVVVQTGTGELAAPNTVAGNGSSVPVVGVNPDDPAVKELRARGFTIFPPVQIPGAVSS